MNVESPSISVLSLPPSVINVPILRLLRTELLLSFFSHVYRAGIFEHFMGARNRV